MAAGQVRIARVYAVTAKAAPGERRILVDRLWPRGMKKDAVQIDAWMRELAPSDKLRRWFGHDPDRWEEFRRRYRAELEHPERRSLLRDLSEQARTHSVVLLYGAKDPEHNQAVVLREVLGKKRIRASSASSASARARPSAGSRS